MLYDLSKFINLPKEQVFRIAIPETEEVISAIRCFGELYGSYLFPNGKRGEIIDAEIRKGKNPQDFLLYLRRSLRQGNLAEIISSSRTAYNHIQTIVKDKGRRFQNFFAAFCHYKSELAAYSAKD